MVSFSSTLTTGSSSIRLVVRHTRAGRGLQSAGISGISNLSLVSTTSLIAGGTYHMSGGTPSGSNAKPDRTGRPSCHLSSPSNPLPPAGILATGAARDGPPITMISSSFWAALSKTYSVAPEPDAPYGSSTSSICPTPAARRPHISVGAGGHGQYSPGPRCPGSRPIPRPFSYPKPSRSSFA